MYVFVQRKTQVRMRWRGGTELTLQENLRLRLLLIPGLMKKVAVEALVSVSVSKVSAVAGVQPWKTSAGVD